MEERNELEKEIEKTNQKSEKYKRQTKDEKNCVKKLLHNAEKCATI